MPLCIVHYELCIELFFYFATQTHASFVHKSPSLFYWRFRKTHHYHFAIYLCHLTFFEDNLGQRGQPVFHISFLSYNVVCVVEVDFFSSIIYCTFFINLHLSVESAKLHNRQTNIKKVKEMRKFPLLLILLLNLQMTTKQGYI